MILMQLCSLEVCINVCVRSDKDRSFLNDTSLLEEVWLKICKVWCLSNYN